MNEKKKKNNNNNNNNNGEEREFEFCEICRLNHNQGRRHNYFPKHKTALSAVLSRFQSKLNDVKLLLKTPTVRRPEHADENRMWCVFCSCDIIEIDSPFVRGNAIAHLASGEHQKRVKSFMWKHGGGMDRVDVFRITEVEFAKWEKRCKALKTEAAKVEAVGPAVGPLNNIHKELNAHYVNSFHKNNATSLEFITTNSVAPLQSYTNEKIQVSLSVLSSGPGPGSSSCNVPGDSQVRKAECLKTSTDCVDGFSFNSLASECSPRAYSSNEAVNSGVRIANGGSRPGGLSNLTQISFTPQQAIEGNVHTGAPPPWFDAADRSQLNSTQKPESSDSFPSKAGKSSKLNPKRVGAAWAERRKLELELERRGGLVNNKYDANWLPNFGRVWQSGTRKESRKEFQTENSLSLKDNNQSESSTPLQPYVSKRMRRDTSE